MDKEVVNKFMVEFLSMLQNAKDFTMEQLPLLAREILSYNLFVDVIHLVIGLSLIVLAVVLCKNVSKRINKNEHMGEVDKVGFKIMAWAIGSVFVFSGIIKVVNNTESIIKITQAPRLYLIEYTKELVK